MPLQLAADLMAEEHADIGEDAGHVRGAHDRVRVFGEHAVLQRHCGESTHDNTTAHLFW